jgi:hypothetical protein
MKAKILLSALLTFTFCFLSSQVPQGFNYQAIARLTTGDPIINTTLPVRITIQADSLGTSIIWQELHSSVTTNGFGLITLVLGKGSRQAASTVATFNAIDWSVTPKFIKTEINYSGWKTMGVTRLWSVPYALHSKASETAVDAVTITGNQTITGIKTFSKDLLVNGLTVGKGNNGISSNIAAGYKALFANTTGYSNTAVGTLALYLNTSGIGNTASGDSALYSNTTGNYNSANGLYALFLNTTGIRNTANGTNALLNNTTGGDNTGIGVGALGNNMTGNNNTANGSWALVSNTAGHGNTSNGTNALHSNTAGSYNTAVGIAAGYTNTTGNFNIFLGSSAGYYETGSNKLFIDNQSRANESDARLKALIYGVFNADPANQVLTINGNVGIGTVASVSGLDVRKESRIGNNQFLTDAIELSYFGSGDRYTYIDFHGDNTYNDYGLRIDRGPGVNANSGLYHRGTGSLFLHTNEAAPITFYTANAQRMTIDAAGKIGIGTASPTAKLEVNQVNPLAWGGNLKALRILSPDNAFYLDINTLIIAAGNTGYHFSPNGNTGLTISTPGYVGIGTSSPISLLNPYMAIGDALNSNAEIMDLTIKPTVNVDHLRFYGIRKVAGTSWSDVALRIQQRVDATDMGYIEFNPSTSGMDLAFGTSNIERLRINSAGNVGIGTTNPTSKFVVQPSSSWDDNTPLFEVRNKTGVPVFAVYNNGVRILVDHTLAKAVKGGFAVGGYDMTKAGKTVDLMMISPDSIRFNINNDNAGKGLKGGFAVGGYDVTSKGPINQDFMYLTPQSATGNGYNTFMGYKAGFNNTLGTYNTFLGFQAGYNNSAGQYNVTIGYQSGYSTATNYNTLLGYQAGYNNSAGNSNTYLGYRAGGNGTNGTANVCIGVDAGYNLSAGNNVCIGNLAGKNTTGGANTYIGWGAGAGQASNDSYANVYIGVNSGMLNKGFTGITASAYDAILGVYIDWPGTSGGSSNVCIGNYSGAAIQGTTNNLGNKNVCIGDRTGIHIITGQNNTFIGSEAGRGVQTGSSNVFIGYRAGYNETGSSKLYISNTNTTAPLIYGDFGGEVVIDGNHSSNTLNRTFFVNGPAGGLYAWYNDSDEKLKRDIIAIPDALEKVLNLRGVNFFWKDPKKGMESLQMGFVGQEVAKVIPEVVSAENNHYSMQYAPVTALLVEAIKEQQLQIESQQKEIDELKTLVNKLIANQTSRINSD